ncbi:hypothetical protein EV361DRAFT_437173 [Lentinula raphanica]|nr:hypothetical protein EV361DRAFT_437173 [Lentinula raphanica]
MLILLWFIILSLLPLENTSVVISGRTTRSGYRFGYFVIPTRSVQELVKEVEEDFLDFIDEPAVEPPLEDPSESTPGSPMPDSPTAGLPKPDLSSQDSPMSDWTPPDSPTSSSSTPFLPTPGPPLPASALSQCSPPMSKPPSCAFTFVASAASASPPHEAGAASSTALKSKSKPMLKSTLKSTSKSTSKTKLSRMSKSDQNLLAEAKTHQQER